MYKDPFKKLIIDKIKNETYSNLVHIIPFFTDESEQMIKEFQNRNIQSFEREEWLKFFESNKDKPLVLYEMLSSKEIPFDIAYDIARLAIDMYKNNNSYDNKKYIAEKLMFKSLEKPLEFDITKAIYKIMNKKISKKLQKFGNVETLFPLEKEIPCPFSQVVLQDLGRIILSKRNDIKLCKEPFRLINNSAYLKDVLENPMCNESIREAIVNNVLISDEIRMQAFNDGVNFHNIYSAPVKAKDIIFKSAVEAYTDLSINPLTKADKTISKSIDEINIYNGAIKLLSTKLMHNFFSEEHQLDLVYRLKDLHGGKVKDNVLGLLFQYTTSKKVLNMASLFNINEDVEKAFQNNNIDKDILMKRCEILFNELDKDNYIKKDKKGTIESVIANFTLSDDKYEKILSSDIENGLLIKVANSYHTPKHILDKTIDRCDELLSFFKHNENKYSTFTVSTISDAKWDAILSKIIKNYLDCSEFESIHKILNNFAINYKRMNEKNYKYYPTSEENCIPKNDVDYISATVLCSCLPKSEKGRKELLSSFEKAVEEYKEKPEIQKNIKEAYMKIKQALYVEKLLKNEKYDVFNTNVLEKIQIDMIREFCFNAENDLSSFYNNFSKLLKSFTQTQLQIDLKSVENEKENIK